MASGAGHDSQAAAADRRADGVVWVRSGYGKKGGSFLGVCNAAPTIPISVQF